MGKYRLKYASVGGAATGKKPGDVITVTGDEEAELLALGLLETEDEYQERQAAKAEAEAAQTDSVTVNVNWGDLSPVVSPERIAELVTVEEDRLLDAHKKGGGWYHFGEGDALVKVQGREDALAELAKLQEAADAAGQPASGQ